ncbi:MAG TPA: DUF58 domain-containing protein [Patescibacteria group bacterium]|nr:DUF58 domain-containing protein [Patescibacteria group bacterium]
MLATCLKKWVLFFLIAAASLLIGMRTSIAFFYLLFWFLVTLVAVCGLWVLCEAAFVTLQLARQATGKVDTGDILEIKVSIHNRSFLPLGNMLLEDYLPCLSGSLARKYILIEYLGPGLSMDLHYRCQCLRRGRYRLGPFSVYFFDPLGLFFIKRAYPVYSELYVYPKTFPIRRFPALSKGVLPWFGIESARAGGDEDEFFGVREYKPGDPIKKIHWFSTALKNRLIVKQYQRQVFFRATLICNLRRDMEFSAGADSVNEYAIKIAASVARYLLDKGISVELIAQAQEPVHIPFNKGAQHLESILKFLAMARPDSQMGLDEIFQSCARHIPDHTTVIVIMPDRDWEHLPLMLPLEKRNVSLIPLVLITSTFKYALSRPELIKDVKIKLSQTLPAVPIVFYRGQDPEEAFLEW